MSELAVSLFKDNVGKGPVEQRELLNSILFQIKQVDDGFSLSGKGILCRPCCFRSKTAGLWLLAYMTVA